MSYCNDKAGTSVVCLHGFSTSGEVSESQVRQNNLISAKQFDDLWLDATILGCCLFVFHCPEEDMISDSLMLDDKDVE